MKSVNHSKEVQQPQQPFPGFYGNQGYQLTPEQQASILAQYTQMASNQMNNPLQYRLQQQLMGDQNGQNKQPTNGEAEQDNK